MEDAHRRSPEARRVVCWLAMVVAIVWWMKPKGGGEVGVRVGPSWRVDRSQATPWFRWLQLEPEIDPRLRHVLAGEKGDLCYWIRVDPGAAGQIVLAVGEAVWLAPGYRLMDVLVDGQVRLRGLDPLRAAGAPHQIATVVCAARDLDADGWLEVRVTATPEARDRTVVLAGLWWFPEGGISPEQAARLVRRHSKSAAALFVPAVSAEEVHTDGAMRLAEERRRRRDRQRQAELRTREGLQRLGRLVGTESPALNQLVRQVFTECLFSKLYDPLLPALPHRWFAPGGFVGQWLWDTVFVANAYAPLDDDATLREVFENFWYTVDHNPEAPHGSYRYGMVPNFLIGWPPVGYSQIPLLGWGCALVVRQTNDLGLAERCLPYLIAFDEWYARERDVDGDGLIEYGAYKPVGAADRRQTARYETFDQHPPLDRMKLTRHPRRPFSGEWYGNVEGVEQTCFLVMNEQGIAELAALLGKERLARRYRALAQQRSAVIQRKMWDEETSFFYSLDRDTDEQIRVRTLQGFLPLTCGAATPEQAASLVRQLRDPSQWWCAYPVPTVALDEPQYDSNGSWRGDMWPPATYLVTCGLNRYGYHRQARELTESMLRLVQQQGLFEHYDSATGEPLGQAGLGMSCVVWSAVIQDIYGVQEDFRTVCVPADATGRRLLLGKLQVAYPREGVVELKTAFPRSFQVEFTQADTPLRIEVWCEEERLPDSEVVSGRRVGFTAQAGRRYRVALVG